MMPGVKSPQLQALVGTCRRLSAARQRVLELEEQRDRLIAELRAVGVTGSLLAERTGLTPGRIAQICNGGTTQSSTQSSG
ncbi:MAG: hypothetical protein QOI82_708 [Actinomycetota bacterium]|jgi:transcriptional regulator with XRE-family HTH domain|nr:hypothetical protein [Actinomycetota bacterium]